jgi:alanyl-tRNA synthetase
MDSYEIRQKFIEFFKNRDHVVVPSASLVPENDPSVLFTTAGMQPLIPYLLGEKHPAGDKLVNVQKCVRTQDIEEVGDNTHDTFFEMLGNWSLGSYFKKEAIAWSYLFLTNKKEGLGLDPGRLYVTCFEGDENAPRDLESFEIWKSLGVPEHKIYFLGKEKNWWSPGDNGPCGPDTEMFYDVVGGLNLKSKEEFLKADDEQKVVEIWNDVFMEYEKKEGKVVGKLSQKNVDTGAGLERLAMVLQGKDNIFDTDLFGDAIGALRNSFPSITTRNARIIADHVRTSAFLITDGVVPGNKDRGYILRRLIRRALFQAYQLGARDITWVSFLLSAYLKTYQGYYKELEQSVEKVETLYREESLKFYKTLTEGLKIFEKEKSGYGHTIGGSEAALLATTYGFPFELIVEKAKEEGLMVDQEGYKKEMEAHRELSRQGGEQKFKGGLLDESPESTRYHTATHLLHQALRTVLGTHVEQKGSNITPERLRFDFTHPSKMTKEEIQKVEEIVNNVIEKDLPISKRELGMDEAKAEGAIGLFEDKYGDRVSVYQVGEGENRFSLEICGGPHVTHTKELTGRFTITKEEAVSAGVRRIKASLL